MSRAEEKGTRTPARIATSILRTEEVINALLMEYRTSFPLASTGRKSWQRGQTLVVILEFLFRPNRGCLIVGKYSWLVVHRCIFR